jgi:hypothetical protein
MAIRRSLRDNIEERNRQIDSVLQRLERIKVKAARLPAGFTADSEQGDEPFCRFSRTAARPPRQRVLAG